MLVRRPRDLKRLLNILRYSYPPVRDAVLLACGDELCELDDWSYYGPFCDDLIAALVQRLLLRLPPTQGPLELMGEVFDRDPGLATIAAFYVRAVRTAGRDAVFDQAGVKWLERNSSNVCPMKCMACSRSAPGLSPLFPWRAALAEPLDWLDDERRRGLERILEADAIAASPPVAGAM